MSAPMMASVFLTKRVEIRVKVDAEKMRKDMARVNIREVFALRGLCASMFFFMT